MIIFCEKQSVFLCLWLGLHCLIFYAKKQITNKCCMSNLWLVLNFVFGSFAWFSSFPFVFLCFCTSVCLFICLFVCFFIKFLLPPLPPPLLTLLPPLPPLLPPLPLSSLSHTFLLSSFVSLFLLFY